MRINCKEEGCLNFVELTEPAPGAENAQFTCRDHVPAVTKDVYFQEFQFDSDIPRGTEYIDTAGGNRVDTRAPDIDEEGGDAE